MNTAAAHEGTLLICIDMQPVFVRAVADGATVLRRCQFALSAARGLGIGVAFTEQVPQKLGATDPVLLALVEAPEVHAKTEFSALAPAGPLASALAAGRRSGHVVLCGVETSVCVFQTASDALRSGLAVTVLSDCVGARREADARACLEALARSGAAVLPSETYFYSVLGSAAHPFFRAFTELVKHYG
jgi:nicotinamidase-related amidase